MNKVVENQINNFFNNKEISRREILSESFGIRCEKILLKDGKALVAKYYINQNNRFNSIKSEVSSLKYLSKKKLKLFPSIKYNSDDLLIVNYIKHNNIKDKNYQKILADEIIKLHSIKNDKFGFNFSSQIGGLEQINTYNLDWVKFFGENRLNNIFTAINQLDPLPAEINTKIENILNNLENYIPKKPTARLLHGDLWEGNILFDDKKFKSFIDPGIYFGHNELEISYLRWFNFVDDEFISYYKDFIKIDENYLIYEPIYQLYYSLLNIYLWDRNLYILDTKKLLSKIKV